VNLPVDRLSRVPPHLTAALHAVRDGDLDAASEAITRAESAGDPPQLTLAARGAIEMRRHDWREAERYFVAAMEHKPDNTMLWMNRGMARFELGSYEAAMTDFHEVLLRDHSIGSAWHKLGACHAMLQNHAEALACMERAVGIDETNAECHHGMSVILSHMGVEEGALHHARLAQKLKPGYYDAEAIEAFTLLRLGRWAEGWQKFESRWKINSPVAPWDYRGSPLYGGDLEGLRGKRVLLRSEQGFGDSIMFARFVPLVAELASSVIVETQSELERLFHVLPATIIVHKRDQVPDFDVQTSLMSLPLLFKTTPETVPPPIRFASAKRDLGVKAGVCWSGGPRPEDPPAHYTDKRRSLSEAQFQPIIDVVKPCIILQYDALKALGATDWQDTADIVGALYTVITVDTAVAHLAGSLGVRVLMLSRADRCWRWPANGKTPWYESMKIFGQPRLGAWQPVIEAVVADIKSRGQE
jgi:tetratricopeptide (TPR) repeat protein